METSGAGITPVAHAEPAPSGVELESVGCPMGCGPAATKLAVGRDRLHGVPGTFVVVRCDTCGLMRTDPRPTMATVGAYYPGDYGPHEGVATAAPVSGRFARLLMALRLDGTRDLLPPISPGTALEVGCASGGFLQKLRRRGWTVYGVEPSREAAARAVSAGFSVHPGPLETAPQPSQPLDLVVASHAFEHLHDPLGSFKRLRSWSKPGAWLACAVPNAGGLLFRRFRGAWYDLDLPRHLFHYTPTTLGAMLARAGWEVTRVRAQRTLNGWAGSLGYTLRDRQQGRSAAGDALLRFPESASPLKVLSAPLSFLASALGETGRMVVWARAVD
jgi:SAM-dependent methyltransferase